jgi:hypothetical protein
MKTTPFLFSALASMALCRSSASALGPGTTTVLGPFVGAPATFHTANQSPYLIQYFGTDLGFSYKHGSSLQFLFGDSAADTANDPIQASTNWWADNWDDSYGSVDLNVYSDPSVFSSLNIPRVKLGQDPNSSEAWAINPGLPMDAFKTPEGGFSNGTREFGVFIMGKPVACQTNAECSALNAALSCDVGLGFWGNAPWDNLGWTGGCLDTMPGCTADTKQDAFGNTIPNTGFCRDTGSSAYNASTPAGRIGAWAFKMRVGIRTTSTSDARSYSSVEFATNRFYNQALATVQSFVPASGAGYTHQNYNVATGSGGSQRVLVWGRPGFLGVNATGRPAKLYFGYVNMPTGPGFSWNVNYYTGTTSGIPQFSTNEANAAPLDLDSVSSGIQSTEPYDVVGQMSVVWVDQLHKWVMFYGGGGSKLPTWEFPTCGLVEALTGAECTNVNLGNGAIRLRTADDPWGPWSPPQDVLVGGDPAVSPLQYQYAPGGILRHPSCTASNCAQPHMQSLSSNEYGFLYAPVIHQPWVKTSGTGVDLIWTVSTWDPYHVVLLRTHINP